MSANVNNESWDGLLGKYLKADDLKDSIGKMVCTGVNVEENEDGEPEMQLEVEVNANNKLWSLNMTNRAKLKELGLQRPKDAIGKVIGYKKVTVTNPNTKKEVESLRITSID